MKDNIGPQIPCVDCLEIYIIPSEETIPFHSLLIILLMGGIAVALSSEWPTTKRGHINRFDCALRTRLLDYYLLNLVSDPVNAICFCL